jgi:hypothetical protein
MCPVECGFRADDRKDAAFQVLKVILPYILELIKPLVGLDVSTSISGKSSHLAGSEVAEKIRGEVLSF